MPLSDKQELFCNEYMLDYNASQAAVRSGYGTKNPRQTGHKLRSDPAIRKRIDELRALRGNRLQIAEEYVGDTLIETISRCLQAEPIKVWNASQRCWEATGEWKFDVDGTLKAVSLLARYLGMEEKLPTPPTPPKPFSQGLSQEQFDLLITAARANVSLSKLGV